MAWLIVAGVNSFENGAAEGCAPGIFVISRLVVWPEVNEDTLSVLGVGTISCYVDPREREPTKPRLR
jgi:hypothetical protein